MALEISTADKELLQKLEEALWRPESRFDIDFMEKVLAEDFIEYGRSGRTYTREAIIFTPSQPIDAVLPLSNLHIRLLTPDVAQVTYNSAVTYDGVLEKGRRSSIWSRTAQGWQMRFHQGTPYV